MKHDEKERRRRDRDDRRGRRKRIRRNPEEARALILKAAHEVLAERGPDAVGLKDIAQAAGVSHALVSHYFGTKAGVIEAVLADHADRRRNALFDHVRDHLDEGPREWMRAYLDDSGAWPQDARLVAWALLGGHIDVDSFFVQRRGLQHAADLLEAQLARLGRDVAREDITFALVMLMVVPQGYAVGRRAIWGSLAEDPSEERDSWFLERFMDLIETLLRPKATGDKD